MKNSKSKAKLVVAVVAGGNSSEDVVSYRSAAQVFEALDRELFEPYLVYMKGREWTVQLNGGQSEKERPVDLNDFSFKDLSGEKVCLEYALIMVHGTPGEDGLMQGYLEMMGIPHSTCGAGVSALTFNKSLTKRLLRDVEGVYLAKEILLRRGEEFQAELIINELGLPLFVKPNASGSSFGVSKVKRVEELEDAVLKAFTESDEVLLEEFIGGREVSCGIMVVGGGEAKKQEWVLPVTELITENEFFDYEAKYTPEKCREVTPADLPEGVVRRLNEATRAAYYALGCRGVVRIDFIIKDNGTPYFIEVNTVPGMSAASIVPQQWRQAGLTMRQAFTMLINNTD